jgi:hypothetical protein
MNVGDHEISVLLLVAGSLCKLYDDLNDNLVFESYSLFRDHKLYINEFLKSMHGIVFAFVSAYTMYPFLLFTFLNSVSFVFVREAFQNPYEFSGLLVCILWSAVLLWFHSASIVVTLGAIPFFLAYILSIVVSYYIFDVYLVGDEEFGHKKLIVRSFCAIVSCLMLLCNRYIVIVPYQVLFFMWYAIGYFLTSCCFQIWLIWTSS